MLRSLRLVLVSMVLMSMVAAAPAAASDHCPAPGGAPWGFTQVASNGDFVFTGKGYGHGVGMSQYGAHGAAKEGCTAEEILPVYYRGVTVGKQSLPSHISVGLIPNVPSNATTKPPSHFASPVKTTHFRNLSDGNVPWAFFDGKDWKPLGPVQPPGATWKVVLYTDAKANKSFFVIVQGTKEIWHQEKNGHSLTPGKGLRADLNNNHLVEVVEKDRTYKRGQLRLRSELSGMPLTAYLNLEEYLYGLAEMPSSFHMEALKSQAIVGRSFAAVRIKGAGRSNCSCDLWDTQYDQVYNGYAKESESSKPGDKYWGKRWVSAATGSSGTVISVNDTVVSGNYASSHGGHSDASSWVWGGSHSHLQAIDDSRWEQASGNNRSTWTKRVSPQALGRAFGVGTAIAVDLPSPRSRSERVGDPRLGGGGMRIAGTTGTVTVSGETARSRLGLPSALFRVVGPPLGGRPITGDWDGDGNTDLGWYRDEDRAVALRMGDGSVKRFHFGRPGDVPVVGDWDGDGTDTLGVVRGIRWYLSNDFSGGEAEIVFDYGRLGDVPLPGNWDGKPGDEAGVIRDGIWYLNDELTGGTAKWSFGYGRITRGDLPLVGDWWGEGRDRVAIVRDGEWHLRNEYASGPADRTFTYGRVTRGDIPVVGDWGGDDEDVTPGVVRGWTWYLRQEQASGAADKTIFFAG